MYVPAVGNKLHRTILISACGLVGIVNFDGGFEHMARNVNIPFSGANLIISWVNMGPYDLVKLILEFWMGGSLEGVGGGAAGGSHPFDICH